MKNSYIEWGPSRVRALAAAIAVVLGALPASATHMEPGRRTTNDNGPDFDLDDPPPTRYHLTPALTFGGKVEADFEYQKNFNLDGDDDEDEAEVQPEGSIAFSYDPAEWLRAYVEFSLQRTTLLESEEGKDESPANLSVGRAYITLREILPGFSLQLGRQRLDDEREWVYDQDLDAARLFYRQGRFGLELSASREELVPSDLLNNAEQDDPIDNYMAFGRVTLGKDSEAGAYVFYRNDRRDVLRRPEDLLFFGVQSHGELSSEFEYWLEAAHVRGERKTRSGETFDIQGYGFDLGLTYLPDLNADPSLTLGVAFGTGDNNTEDNTDRAFRQSGLQDNNAKFNGVTSLKYYGETLEPELSNMLILTAGVGVRPSKRVSVDIVYHYYRQHHAEDDLRDTNLDEDPDGEHNSLGHGIDFVVGFREVKDLDIELVLGAFLPGPAFDNDARRALFTGIDISYKF